MRILMLGNSFTFFNDMPETLASQTGWEVVAHTRGGAYLSEHLDPDSELGAKTLPALAREKWDAVVLQEQSRGPYEMRDTFLAASRRLCALARKAGAVPVFYATWAYRDGSEKLASTGMNHDDMLRALSDGYHAAAKENGAPVAEVGQAFAAAGHLMDLYDPEDDYHPSPAGSLLAAQVLAQCIRSCCENGAARG